MTAAGSAQTGLPRVFWALLAGHLINRLGGFAQPFLALYLTDGRGLTAGTAAAVMSAVGVGMVASQVVGGWLADRLGRRLTMIAGFAGNAVALIGLAQADTVVVIGLTACAVGVTGELFRPALSAAVADVVRSDDRGRAYGLLVWGANLGFSVSTAVGGVLAAAGYGLLFWVNALTSAAAAMIIRWFVPDTRASVSGGGRRLLGVAARDRLLIASAGAYLLYGAVYFQAFSTLPLVMAADGLATSTYGLLIAGNGLLIVVFQPLAGRVLGNLDHAPVLAVSMLIVGAGFALGAAAHTWPRYAVSIAVWTVGEIGAGTALGAVFAVLAPRDLRGGYMGLSGLAWATGAALGPIAGTLMLALHGRAGLWIGCGVVGLALFSGHLMMAPALRARVAALPDSLGQGGRTMGG
jgi:MFS family permease